MDCFPRPEHRPLFPQDSIRIVSPGIPDFEPGEFAFARKAGDGEGMNPKDLGELVWVSVSMTACMVEPPRDKVG